MVEGAWICSLDLVEGTSNGGGSVGYAASIWWKEPPMVEGALDMPPRFGGRSLDLVEGTSNAASIWWKKPQITTPSTAIGGSKKVVVEEVTIGCYLNPQNSLCTST
jgi:hypothetical protein